MKTATRLYQLPDFRGIAYLYHVDPPIYYEVWEDARNDYTSTPTNFIAVSAVDNEWARETYIFPTDGEGQVLSWGEMNGSFQGAMDHGEALKRAGYEEVIPENTDI
jgi:hypothetical protein